MSMKIAIAGCGITGSAVACFLAQAGHRVTIFEQASDLKPLGAGIMLQPSGQAILKQLNLLEPIEAVSSPLAGMTARLTSGRELIRLRYAKLNQELVALGVHRGRLFQMLFESCQKVGVEIRKGCWVKDFEVYGFEKKTKLRVHFTDNRNEESEDGFDFLIGADGIRSTVRQSMTDKKLIRSKLFEYDYAAFWLTTPTEYRSDELYQTVEGTQKLIGLLPIGQNECSFFWGLKAAEYDEVCRSDFSKWKLQVIEDCPASEPILQDKQSFEEFTFGKYGHVTVNRVCSDRVILLGDSAHATSPHLGQGANLGLEDAFEFAQCLGESEDFENACHQFTKRRMAKIRYYQRLTKFLSPFFQSNGWFRGKVRDLFLPWFPSVPLVRTQMLRTLCGLKNGWLS